MKKAIFSVLTFVMVVGIISYVGTGKAEAYSIYSYPDINGNVWFSNGGYAYPDINGNWRYDFPNFTGYSYPDINGNTIYDIQPRDSYYSYNSDWGY